MRQNTQLYHSSFHHNDEIKRRLRALKRDLTVLSLHYLFEMDRRWITTLDSGLFNWSMVWRYLPWRVRNIPAQPHDQNNPLWREFADEVVSLADCHEVKDRIDPFLRKAMRFIVAMYEEEENWEDEHLPGEVPSMGRQHADVGWFGCFRYHVGTRLGTTADSPIDPTRAEIHIQNNVAPESPFHDRYRLFTWMSEMAKDMEAKHPRLQRVGTGSWLNNKRSFLQIYPASYKESLDRFPGDNKSGLGTWGQFIAHGLTLNKQRAEILRRELRFPCPQLQGTCNVDHFKDHVDQQLRSLKEGRN